MHCDLRVLAEGGPLERSIVVGVSDRAVQVTIPSHCRLLVPEPPSRHLLQVVRSHVRDPGRDFCAVDEAVEVGQLLGVGQRDVCRLVELEQVVEVLVPGPENLGLVDLNG